MLLNFLLLSLFLTASYIAMRQYRGKILLNKEFTNYKSIFILHTIPEKANFVFHSGESESVNFGMWLRLNCTQVKSGWIYKNKHYSTGELYKPFLKELNAVKEKEPRFILPTNKDYEPWDYMKLVRPFVEKRKPELLADFDRIDNELKPF